MRKPGRRAWPSLLVPRTVHGRTHLNAETGAGGLIYDNGRTTSWRDPYMSTSGHMVHNMITYVCVIRDGWSWSAANSSTPVTSRLDLKLACLSRDHQPPAFASLDQREEVKKKEEPARPFSDSSILFLAANRQDSQFTLQPRYYSPRHLTPPSAKKQIIIQKT